MTASARGRRLMLAIAVSAAALVPTLALLFGPDPAATRLSEQLEGPSVAHPLGTDLLGRDLLARVLEGVRLSSTTGLLAAALSIVLGASVGLAAAFGRRSVDSLLMRIVDSLAALPTLVVSILLIAALGNGRLLLVIAIALTEWFVPARVVRTEARRLRNLDFVEASRNLGSSALRQIWTHVLPHLVPTLAATLAITVPRAILAEAFLSFLGLGVAPPAVSLGGLLAESLSSLDPSIPRAIPLLAPAVALLCLLLAVNLAGESIRSRNDPNSGGRGALTPSR